MPFLAVFALFLFILGSIFFSHGYMTLEYIKRCIVWGPSDVKDVERFPFRSIHNASPAFIFPNASEKEKEDFLAMANQLSYRSNGKWRKVGDLDRFPEENDTTAFIVIQDDRILYEKYFNGYQRDSLNTSFSVAKSFVSALIGIAINEGLIKGVDEPVTKYIPELRNKGFEAITIRHLLTMSSGIKYVEGRLFWGDDAKTYYDTNLRQTALDQAEIAGKPGERFHYNNYNPLLLGLILERVTNRPVSEYLQEKIWKPVGMEYPASWSLDSQESGFEKMESGVNARAIDFAKFGRLFLHKGNWNGKQILSEDWVIESTKPDLTQDRKYYEDAWFKDGNIYYKYFWYSYPRSGADYDFFAAGHLGQYIFHTRISTLDFGQTGNPNRRLPYLRVWRSSWSPFIGGIDELDELPASNRLCDKKNLEFFSNQAYIFPL